MKKCNYGICGNEISNITYYILNGMCPSCYDENIEQINKQETSKTLLYKHINDIKLDLKRCYND